MWAPAARFDLRARLFVVSLLLLACCGGASAVWLESRIRSNFEVSLQGELQEQAFLLTLALEGRPLETLDAFADRARQSTETRFSIIMLDGSVVGDSQVTREQLPALDNHLTRPEVQDALRTGSGAAQRFSQTLQIDMQYVAVAWPLDEPQGVVRAAVPMTQLQATIRQLRIRMLLAGIVGMVVAILMSGLASHWVSRDLRDLVRQAHRLAEPGTTGRLTLPESSQGELRGLVGSINRLSEDLDQTLEALASERYRFGAVLEGMADAVIAVDQERRISLVNPAALRLFQPHRSPLGLPLVSLIRDSHVHAVVEAAIQGEDGSAEFELNSSPARQILVNITTQQQGHGCVLVCRDVTGLRRLERMRRDFITNVSHELRTPVTIIRANAETLLNGALSDQTHGPIFTTAILRNSERLEQLIDGLLNLSSLESGRYTITLSVLQLSQVVEKVYSSLRTHAAERGQQLEVVVPEDLYVLADPQALGQILTNLIENALKYSTSGSTVEVSAWPEDDDGWIRLEVSDEGPGISEHHQNRIFERFYRVDAGRAKNMGGSGLGLSIVKHLADAMGCHVGVSSEPPHGTTFWLQLPEVRGDLGED